MVKRKMENCATCGEPLGFCDFSRGKCEDCYQVESRLEKYVQSKKGRRFVAETLVGR